MSRPSRDANYMEMAHLVSERATCARRNVGCVLTNERGHVLATGYNGVAAGLPHCNEVRMMRQVKMDEPDVETFPHLCGGSDCKSGEGLELCEAIHAEQNALLQCKDVYKIKTCYSTTQPCVHCTKLLLNTSCQEIYYSDPYPNEIAQRLWKDAGRALIHIPRKS